VETKSDAELVESARRGDIDGFGELYRRHYGGMVGIAYALLADRHAAEDAAQEAFAVACRDLPRLRDADRFPAWLSAICRNVARGMAASAARRVAMEAAASGAEEATPAEREIVEFVRQSVVRLPAAHREAVMLHYFSGLSHEEAARVLGVTPQAVHGRLQRARRAIAKDLNRRHADAVARIRGRMP
jgi:RNA polymerase sigma-70 factor (ECF subfamily)